MNYDLKLKIINGMRKENGEWRMKNNDLEEWNAVKLED